jgi:hypothetical protein
MAENTVSKSFRIPQIDAVWLQDLAKNTGNTQTEILSKALTYARLNEGKELALESMSNGGITEDEEAIKVLSELGIATAYGFAGFEISGWIRKQLEMDEDKGTQILFGMVIGLGTLILRNYKDIKK